MKPNNFMIWNEEFSVWEENLDNQHKKIIDIINVLKRSQEIGKELEASLFTLAELNKYVGEHFNTEEQYLAKKGYPNKAGHIIEHRYFSQRLTVFTEDVKKNRGNPDKKFLLFLKQWWTNHILTTDMDYASFVQKKIRVALKAEENQ